jgi:hypothetical protein
MLHRLLNNKYPHFGKVNNIKRYWFPYQTLVVRRQLRTLRTLNSMNYPLANLYS